MGFPIAVCDIAEGFFCFGLSTKKKHVFFYKMNSSSQTGSLERLILRTTKIYGLQKIDPLIAGWNQILNMNDHIVPLATQVLKLSNMSYVMLAYDYERSHIFVPFIAFSR